MAEKIKEALERRTADTFPSQLNSRGTAVGMILYLKNDKAIKCIKNLKM